MPGGFASKTSMFRQFSSSCLDLDELWGSGGEGGADVEQLSPRSRGRKVVALAAGQPDIAEMPKTPPGRGSHELTKTFSGSCLELDGLGMDPPSPTNEPNGRFSPLQQVPARQIIEYVHLQNTRRKTLDRNRSRTVLVTGAGAAGAEFLAAHIIAKLLHEGYHVKATVRDEQHCEKLIEDTRSSSEAKLDVVFYADPQTGSPDFILKAVQGCEFVIHCPSLAGGVTAMKEGVQNLFGAIKKAGTVKRIVMVGSATSVHQKDESGELHEGMWNNVAKCDDPLSWGRVQAEKEAWEQAKDISADLTVLLPSTSVGASLGSEISDSIKLIRDLVNSSTWFPFAPRICRNLVDVRDVSEACYTSLEAPAVCGKRCIIAGGNYTLSEISRVIKLKYPHLTPPVLNAWDFVTLFVVPFMNPQITKSSLRLQLGYGRNYSSKTTKECLKLTPRQPDAAILEVVDDLINRGEVPDVVSQPPSVLSSPCTLLVVVSSATALLTFAVRRF